MHEVSLQNFRRFSVILQVGLTMYIMYTLTKASYTVNCQINPE